MLLRPLAIAATVACALSSPTLAADSDADGDGVADRIDNCILVANAGQEDVEAGEDDDSSLPGVQHYGDACDADLDNDGIVGASDFFGVFRPCLGRVLAEVPACRRADLDGDGVVGASDFFGVLRPRLGTAPGPGYTGEPAPAGRVGDACSRNDDCSGIGSLCVFGFCTRTCGPGGAVVDCGAVGVAAPDSAYGGSFACWSLGPDLISLCWPNGSGTACSGATDCPRPEEACIGGGCSYATPAGTETRTDMRCHADADCRVGEGCALMANLDATNLRSDGACLWRRDPPDSRRGPGEACGTDEQCASFVCRKGVCAGLCESDSHCLAGTKCVAEGRRGEFEEFDSEFAGLCVPWAGSAAPCAGNAHCPAGEECAPYQELVQLDRALGVATACRLSPNPAGLAVGAACASDADCRSDRCLENPLTGLGYCSAFCVGGDADCGGATACRALLFNGQDPGSEADDLRVGSCVRTGLLELCGVAPACRVCTSDAECNAAQGVSCVRRSAGEPVGVCRDRFGRCAEPCRHDCTPGGGECPSGTSCESLRVSQTEIVNYCREDPSGECVRADLEPALRYEHGMCGDVEYPLAGGPPLAQQDLCYYFGRNFLGGVPRDLFACGSACSASCPVVPTASGGIATVCRTVYEFGVNRPGPPPTTLGGAPLSPAQCAPANAFVGF